MRIIYAIILALILAFPALAQRTPKTITADVSTSALLWPTNLWDVERGNIYSSLGLWSGATNQTAAAFRSALGLSENTTNTTAAGWRSAIGVGEISTNTTPAGYRSAIGANESITNTTPAGFRLAYEISDIATNTLPANWRAAIGVSEIATNSTAAGFRSAIGVSEFATNTTASGWRSALAVPANSGGFLTNATISGSSTFSGGILTGSSYTIATNAGLTFVDGSASPIMAIVDGRIAFSDNWPVIVDATDAFSPRYSVAVSNTAPSVGAILNRGTADYRYGLPTTFSKTGLVQAASASVARNALGFDAAAPGALGTNLVAAGAASTVRNLIGLDVAAPSNVGTNLLVASTASAARTILGINAGAEVDVKNDYGAVGNGIADDTTPFVNALAGVTDGGTINVPVGTYLVNTNVLYLEGKSVRIRGVPGKSIIKNPNATTSFGTTGFSTWGRFGATSTLLSVPVYQNRQTRTIPVVSSSGFSVGQYVWLHDTQVLTNWNSISHVNKQIMRIESISGNNITFDRAPVKTFLPQYGARMVSMNIGPTQLIVEGIVMDGYGFTVDGAHDCVFRDVDIINTDSGNMFGFYYCSDVLISHCSSKSSPTKTPPSVAYGFSINGGENITVEDSTFTGVSECNVIYPCYSVKIMRNTFNNTQDMNIHGDGERETWVVNNTFINSFLSLNAAGNLGTQNTHVSGNKFAGSFGSTGRINSYPGSAASPTVTANNGLAYKSNGGIWHGMPVMFWGTLPNEIIAYTNYFLLQPGASATNVCFSASKPKPPVAVTFDSTPGNWTVSAGSFAHQDVMTFDAGTVPAGLTAGRYYYLAQKTGGVWYLSPAYDLSNPTWDTAADTVTLTAGVWNNGDAIHFESYGTPPTGISKGTLYYLKLVSGSTFNLALTPGGATIDMTGSASGGFYTCTAFSTDGANAWAAIGTPVKGLTGTLGSISMFPISYGAVIENNDITDVQSYGIELIRYGDVLISGNRIGPHGWTINTPIAFNLQECVGVQVTGNRVELNISGSYIAKLANSRNMLFQGNYFSSPSSATVPAFGIGTSTTNYGLKIIGNEFPNHASRETVINTNTVRPAICGGGLMRGNIYAGRAEQGSASSLSASALSVVPGTVPQYQVVSSSLGSTIYQVLNDNAVVPGDEITIARSAAGAGDVVMQLQSNTNTTVCNLTSGTYGFVRLAFDPSTWGWLKVEGATNTVGMP